MKRHLITGALITFLLFAATGCFNKGILTEKPALEHKGYTNITPQELKEKLERKEKLLLLDVRTKDEYDDGHIKGAINIPHTEIVAKDPGLGCRCREIVVYCRSGMRSVTAARALIELGYKKTQNLVGGIQAWEQAGGEVIR
jgi:rhodanese-related sulfurtransferase